MLSRRKKKRIRQSIITDSMIVVNTSDSGGSGELIYTEVVYLVPPFSVFNDAYVMIKPYFLTNIWPNM